MNDSKAGGSKSHHKFAVFKENDGASSLTAVTVESDSDASSTTTLVDLFPDLAVASSDVVDESSAESTDATSSQVSSSSNESSEDAASEVCLKKNNFKCIKHKNRKEEKTVESETESEESSAAKSTSENEPASDGVASEVDSSEAAVTESEMSGDASSNEDGTSSDASLENEDASSSAQSSNTGTWTPSEDALILSMKAGGETWTEIGKAINRGKNEVKKRWHVVKANNANSTESEGDKPTGNVTNAIGERNREIKEEKKQKKKAKKQQKAEPARGKSKKVGQKKKHAVEDSAQDPAPSESDDAQSLSSYRARMNLLQDTSSVSESEYSSVSGNDNNDPDAPGYYERELILQNRYIRRHVHPALYPVTTLEPPSNPPLVRAPSPADKRQRRDDAIFAAVASRREATRWLEMQANFFNVTGRMVPLHLIKARCEAEEDKGKAAGVRQWASSVAVSDELLDPQERGDVPDDALISDED
ncbi:uncharacterized protein CTRU02_201913 [Colletotrichum truncatum]|uniref:Uncharacterized protein n=1 Tax=Colletotrichum truncatum TaxID=5467 RepID=A0ACC3ZIU5_COLTU|nr:uncharacterized protein CTRU02_07024 [Colletotrichum truncatum]KAF6791840.1 hypothetical protein CTRU02_07024 [Colletotrichum truncatum]